ncbi:peptide-methionine (S)-S-oxide reductase MsrA [Vibrio maerlii]|uniref:peptide-methionine (S)-S-oxide reductase MsrA n=1 Tax=Vibrio maerlii TaxID=2231648 RepID=UPI000E3CBF02|nr:peptide-methionine (S)-S-oxide reductase MsrA [Vibrio maerlii]
MFDKTTLISADDALLGRDTPMTVTEAHFVNHTDLTAKPQNGCQEILLGMGCFWGAERLFWKLDGVVSTSVGYAGGYTPNPSYEEVCTGKTGHSEVVRVIYDPAIISLEKLLRSFWENHDPTQGMKQGNDVGTQYRSVIYPLNEEQLSIVEQSKQEYQSALGNGVAQQITTEIQLQQTYYFAEAYHQQYLAKNPQGYCGLGGTGVCFPDLSS